jgi:hypothetical protein
MKNHRPADKLLFLNGDQTRAVLSYELIPAIGQALVIFLPVGASNERRPSAVQASTATTCLDTTFSRAGTPYPKGFESGKNSLSYPNLYSFTIPAGSINLPINLPSLFLHPPPEFSHRLFARPFLPLTIKF